MRSVCYTVFALGHTPSTFNDVENLFFMLNKILWHDIQKKCIHLRIKASDTCARFSNAHSWLIISCTSVYINASTTNNGRFFGKFKRNLLDTLVDINKEILVMIIGESDKVTFKSMHFIIYIIHILTKAWQVNVTRGI